MLLPTWLLGVNWQWLWILLPVFYLGMGFIVILETRNPAKALAYILLIILLPPLGIFIFYLFGRDLRKRKRFTLKGHEDREKLKRFWQAKKKDIQLEEEEIEREWLGLVEPIRMLHRRNQSILTEGNRAELLVNGKETFPCILDALRAAEHHIHLEYYTFSDDDVGRQVADALIGRARAGVEVRVVADQVGSSDIGAIPKDLRAAGVQFHYFQPVRFTSLASANYRNHRKIVVIDGKVGFVGGLNLNDRYWNTGKHDLYWRDSHMRLLGPAVNNLQMQFLLSWQFVGGESFPLSKPYFGQAEPDADGAPVITVASGPDSERPFALDCLVSLIHEARRSVRITNPYVLPPEALSTALEIAAASGIQVDLILPGTSDSWIVHYASHSYLQPLLQAGVNVYAYEKGFVHAKTMIIDNRMATIGTVNLDARSFFINFEIMALVYDEQFARDLDRAFDRDLQDCVRFDPAEWENRSLPKKLLESSCRLLTPLI